MKAPRDPLFDTVIDALRASRHRHAGHLKTTLAGRHDKPGARLPVAPHLLLRSYPGDRGERPLYGDQTPAAARAVLETVVWLSPDLWVWPGFPGPDLPPAPTPDSVTSEWPNVPHTVTAGATYTLYAHAWNLGLAPAGRARVDFALFPGPGHVDPAGVQPIGAATVDLMPRATEGCHRLVRCPRPWVAPPAGTSGSRLVVRVSTLGDPIGDPAWDPIRNRHVAGHMVRVAS